MEALLALPAVSDSVPGILSPTQISRTIALTASVIPIPEKIAIFPNAVDDADTWKSALVSRFL